MKFEHSIVEVGKRSAASFLQTQQEALWDMEKRGYELVTVIPCLDAGNDDPGVFMYFKKEVR